MIVDVQDYAVLLCRDVHQSVGQKDGRCREGTRLPVQIDAYGVSNLTRGFRSTRWCFLGPVKLHY